jgi:hypothetical protein
VGQYIVDYTLANAVTNRFVALWGGEEGVNFCVANITDDYLVTNMVNPTKSRCYVLVLLGSFICPVASGKFGGFKIFCSIGWFCIN